MSDLFRGQTVRVKPHASVARHDVGRLYTVIETQDPFVIVSNGGISPRNSSVAPGFHIDALEPDYEDVPIVVHVRLDEWDAYIGRKMVNDGLPTSPFANPFAISGEADRAKVIRAYGQHLARSESILALLPLLRGKRIACWCKKQKTPSAPCHGDVIVAILRSADDDEIRRVCKLLVKGEIDEWDIAVHAGQRVADRCSD